MLAALLRPAPAATATGVAVKTERALAAPATAEFLDRVDRNIRAALARRLPHAADAAPR